MTVTDHTWTSYIGKLPEPYADSTPQNVADMLRDHADPKINIAPLDLAALVAADLIVKQAAEIEQLKAAIAPQPTTADPITVAYGIATTTDIVRLRAAAQLWRDAMSGQHEMFAHWLDGCRKCRKARREGDPHYACDQYKTWQKQYEDAVGAW
ncbi:hypothetical protein [Catenuloplanes indicus]|uniref:Uncharacterized protein n=1 Tax=Catenuloplanes indicus TaxID=137267 RepID=A0AAE3W8P4_9ACTN|nr:hypothetical protein [Catenuloplanes indicus]MDQ0371574.1 hypothetical protein [Catenuloplanes indicus]